MLLARTCTICNKHQSYSGEIVGKYYFIALVVGSLNHGDGTAQYMGHLKIELRFVLWNLQMLCVIIPGDYTPIAITLKHLDVRD
jgi:hypothetical protein